MCPRLEKINTVKDKSQWFNIENVDIMKTDATWDDYKKT